MDQLHEELKQPIIDENDVKEEEPSMHQPRSSPVIGQNIMEGQQSLDNSSTSSQSDGDYETCDSAIGSEKDSNDHNGSSDEEHVNEMSRLNISSNSLRSSRKSQISSSASSDSGIAKSDNSSNRGSKLKEKKDSANKSLKQADNVSVCSDDQRSDPGDYVDAEQEPAKARRLGRRTTSVSSLDRQDGVVTWGGARQKTGKGLSVHSGCCS